MEKQQNDFEIINWEEIAQPADNEFDVLESKEAYEEDKKLKMLESAIVRIAKEIDTSIESKPKCICEKTQKLCKNIGIIISELEIKEGFQFSNAIITTYNVYDQIGAKSYRTNQHTNTEGYI